MRLLAPLTFALSLLVLSGCQSFLSSRYADSVPPNRGIERLTGLAESVSIRRNSLGMPLIEANNFHDTLFALGYVHAGDRLSQMEGMRLLAQGRLAEWAGEGALEMDRFMRAVNLKKSAEQLYNDASPRLKAFFEVYARGVNAYLYRYRNRLPMDLAQAGHHPAYWKAEDSVLIFCLINFGLAVNLQEELSALAMAQKVGASKLPWLLPVYPDEALPFDEAEKLSGLDLTGNIPGLSQVSASAAQVSELHMLGVAASNNWAFSPQRTTGGKSLLANDTHLPLSMPSMWNFVQVRSPKYQAAGISLAGLPAIVAGYNGHLAWGMTMVMGDNQDIFLERIKRQGNHLMYEANGQWLQASERFETFFIKGQKPIRETIYETRNGPLLNSVLGERKHLLQPLPIQSGYGLALKTAQFEQDTSLDAFFNLSRAQTVDQAFESASEIRAMPLNLIFADANHIGWQVTGRYPNRREGRGLMPSPGWDDRYSWDGFADAMLHPYDQDPPQGWLGTANQRTVQPGYGMQLSSSWFYPERAERISELASQGQHDVATVKRMQYDQHSPFVGKLQAMFNDPGMHDALHQAINALPTAQRANASFALERLLNFDSNLSAQSADAAIYSAFLQESAKAIFLDELGPEQSLAWQALVEASQMSYSAQADHLLGQFDSPFWDDISTPVKEDKPAILALSLARAIEFLEQRLGKDRQQWQWGKLHSYEWVSDTTRMAPYMSSSQRIGVESIKSYLDRGPYPAGGDHTTLNVSAYRWGENFDTTIIPAMRIIVDFSADEPFIGMNSSGQSGNPASAHYADGIAAWLKGQYMSFPFKEHNLEKVYGKQSLLLIPSK